jgi:2-phospho-L-lactate guanylyltransferase
VPVKERVACKSRLSSTLSARGRLDLVRTLLHHVIGVLRDTPAIDHIALVSPERDDIPADILLLANERQGINQDLTRALPEVVARGAKSAIIVAADLPLLDRTDIAALLERMKHSGVPIAPDRHQLATNALALELPSPVEPSFGEGSLARHLADSHMHGIEAGLLHRRGFSHDIDNIEDLQQLRASKSWSAFT